MYLNILFLAVKFLWKGVEYFLCYGWLNKVSIWEQIMTFYNCTPPLSVLSPASRSPSWKVLCLCQWLCLYCPLCYALYSQTVNKKGENTFLYNSLFREFFTEIIQLIHMTSYYIHFDYTHHVTLFCLLIYLYLYLYLYIWVCIFVSIERKSK